MTNQVKYDRNKDHQGLFDKVFFEQSYENNLMLLNVTFQCEKDYPTEPPPNKHDVFLLPVLPVYIQALLTVINYLIHTLLDFFYRKSYGVFGK